MHIFYFILLVLLSFNNAESAQEALACEHETLRIECPKGYTINVLAAMYGKVNPTYCNSPNVHEANCRAEGTLDIVKKHCKQRQVCEIDATVEMFTDPCPYIRKYLQVSYECEKANILTVVACEDVGHLIKCPEGQHIRIANAMYGRTDPLTCYLPSQDIRRVHCVSPNSRKYMEQWCENKSECWANAVNSFFGDPCSGTHKYLEVDYQCLNSGDI